MSEGEESEEEEVDVKELQVAFNELYAEGGESEKGKLKIKKIG